MGRHADPTAPTRRLDPRILLQPGVLLAAFVVVALVAGGIVWLAGWHSSAPACSATQTVRVAVAPEMAATVKSVLHGELKAKDGSCAVAAVSARQPLQTVADFGVLPASSLPQVWVPDSSLWQLRAQKAALAPAGSLGWSPIVLATSRAAVAALNWGSKPPTWAAALTGQQPVAVPDLATSAEGISALAAVRASLGGDQNADNAVVQAVLAAERGPAGSAGDALDAAGKNDANAPLVPVSEQEVFARVHGSPQSSLTAVYPSDGSPRLDYPVLRVGTPAKDQRAAVDAVVSRLGSAAAHTAAHTAGLREQNGAAPGDLAGIRADAPAPVALDPGGVQQLLGRLAALAKPSRILAVFDVSTSMRAPVGSGTRITLARDAAKSALTLVPDTSAIGLWDFAFHLNGNDDFAELVPTRPLSADAGGMTQRAAIAQQLNSLPDRLAPGGTGLYDTTLAAVRSARSNYDPAAVDSVLIVTDGANDDGPGELTLQQLVDTLKAEADPGRPVKVIAVGLGPDADLAALKQIADATGGAAYSAVDPRDLQTVLFDALRQRQ